jgi:PKD repeat protein
LLAADKMGQALNLRGGVCALAFALLCTACAGPPASPPPTALRVTPAGLPPTVDELEAVLQRELASRGLDPARAVAKAPTAGSEVIDLEALKLDPDGGGPQPPTGYLLNWTERLTGDYDENGEANVNDVTTLAANWQQTVQYDNPLQHDGCKVFPIGDPVFDGDVPAGQPPLIGSGAYNWRLARTDGDGNGEVFLSDLTALAQHFKEHLDGYRVYRRKAGTAAFALLEDPAAPGQPLLVSRASVNDGHGVEIHRPVRYAFIDAFSVDGDYEYRVAPFDAATNTAGPPSLPGFDVQEQVQAKLKASVTQGAAPLQVTFDGAESSVAGGTITGYFWDLNGDGVYETNTGATPTVVHTFTTPGAKTVGLGVEASTGDTATTEIVVSVTAAPTARLAIPSPLREVPLTLTLDATTSSDPDGEVVRYAWDMDGDGGYELDTGPIGVRQLAYTAPGTHSIGVRVTDNFGATDTASIQYTLTDDYDEVEDNDSFLTATPLGPLSPGQSVAGVSGSIGTGLYDGDMDDWFAFDVADGAQVSVQLAFLNAQANLDLQLVDTKGLALIAAAATSGDGEQLLGKLKKAGRYYLRVYRAFGPGGNSAPYSLSLACSALTYDETEPNDTAASAQDAGDISVDLLPSFWGQLGQPAGDSEDWLRFAVGFSSDFDINLAFFHDQADLELQVYTADGQTLLGDSSTVNDNEHVLVHLTPGAYLLRTYRFGAGHANYELSVLVH